jgi:hypothetical protein
VVAVNTDGNGRFNEEIDFNNHDLFNGQALWLGLQVAGEASEMTPRQYLRPVPYALSIRPGAVISGSVAFAGDYGGAALAVLNDDGRGVYAEVSGSGNAGRFISHGNPSGVYAESDGSGNGIYAVGSDNAGDYGGQFHGWGGIYTSADTGPGVVVSDSTGIATTYSQDPGDVVTSDDLLADNALGLGAPGVHGAIYVRDNANETMFDFTASNSLLTLGGPGDDGDLYIMDDSDSRIFQVDGQTGSFYVFDGTGTSSSERLFEFDSTFPAEGGSMGAIWGDQTDNLGNLSFRSNDDVDVYLEQTNPGGTVGHFRIYDNAGTVVFQVDEDGDVWAAGDADLDQGTKSAIVQTQEYGRRKLYCVESPGVWFEDFGTAQLVNGQATVTIEPIFLETINTDEPYHVFVTPLGDCSGLYVTKKTATSFEVRELGGGTSNVEFDYRIAAKRLGFEDLRLEQPEPPVEEEEMPGAPPRSPSLEEESGQSEDVDLGRNLTPAEVEPEPGEDM